MFSIGQKIISYIDEYFFKYSAQNMSFWANLPCPTHTLITGNILHSHNKEYFFVHALVLQKVVICECPLHWHQIRYQF